MTGMTAVPDLKVNGKSTFRVDHSQIPVVLKCQGISTGSKRHDKPGNVSEWIQGKGHQLSGIPVV